MTFDVRVRAYGLSAGLRRRCSGLTRGDRRDGVKPPANSRILDDIIRFPVRNRAPEHSLITQRAFIVTLR